MELQFILLVVAMAAGQVSSYTTTVLSRGGESIAALDRQGAIRSILGFAGMAATFAVVIWGFMNLTWWWVVLVFLAVALFIIPRLVSRSTLPLMTVMQPILDIICISITAYLWFA